ncbi:MAG: hypothetical protein KBH23_06220 [Bacteroidaceae bacterium]|nr:hypothetical protein [Bacteroidaceae bacterium]
MKAFTTHELKVLTLAQIQEMRCEVKKDLQKQSEVILQQTKSLTEPYQKMAVAGSNLASKMRTGFTIFSGVLTGLRLIKSLRHPFR